MNLLPAGLGMALIDGQKNNWLNSFIITKQAVCPFIKTPSFWLVCECSICRSAVFCSIPVAGSVLRDVANLQMLLAPRVGQSQPLRLLAAKALKREGSRGRELEIFGRGQYCGPVTSGELIAHWSTAKTHVHPSRLGSAGFHPGSDCPASGPYSTRATSESQRAFFTKTRRGRAFGQLKITLLQMGWYLRCVEWWLFFTLLGYC